MADEVLERGARTREEAHAAATLAYQHAQAVIANGRPVQIVAKEHDDDRTLRQNKFYWGACLRDISEQARIGGQRYTVDAWHELFKRQFLGFEVTKVLVAGRKRPTVIRRLRSTARLKVRAMSKYLDEVQALAATELGVQFTVQRWEDYRE